jgi:Holliday junction resolvase
LNGKKSKSAKAKGYSVERDCVLLYRKSGIFAIRIPTRAQVGALRSIDVVACRFPEFIQCKRRKKYLYKPEKERIKLTAKNFNGIAMLCWRDNGLKFERLSDA